MKDYCASHDTLRVELKKSGSKVTPVRLKIIEIVHRSKVPMNIEQIARQIKGKRMTADIVTVYRTLKHFERAGMVRRVDLHKDKVFYEFVHESDDHHHLICTQCGKIEDISPCALNHKSIQLILKRSALFSEISSHALELFGLCTICARKL